MKNKLFEIKDILRNGRYSQTLYMYLRTYRHRNRFKLYRETYVETYKDNNDGLRINLIVPNFTKSSVYGGISTALKFYSSFCSEHSCEQRIIVTGVEHFSNRTYHMDGFRHNSESKGLFFLSEQNKLSVRKNDIFIYTSWFTAYAFFSVLDWQKETFGIHNRKIIYLIQDYEPGFYPWSTEYCLSESTYRRENDTIAVFNSLELKNYFEKLNYKFYKSFCFKPYLNENLKKVLLNAKTVKKEKIILLYGRPVNDRNAFGLIYSALNEWSKEYEDSANWKIYALGDRFSNIRLKNNIIEFKGKLSLVEYAELMLRAYAAISLMVSPHPSYPPLEMSTFGIKTITNMFGTKDLSTFNNNIISLSDYTPASIKRILIKVCSSYSEKTQKLMVTKNAYIAENDFENCVKDVNNSFFDLIDAED